jgi:dienelactone hydrolase
MTSSRLLEYQHADTTLQGLLVTDAGWSGPRPGVLIAHAWGGRGANEAAAAQRLAGLGYAAFALDLYGKGVSGGSREQNAALIRPFLEDRQLLQARMALAVSVLQQQAEVALREKWN